MPPHRAKGPSRPDHRGLGAAADLARDGGFRDLIEHLPLGVAVVGPSKTVIALNRRMREMFPSARPKGRPLCYDCGGTTPRRGLCPRCPTSLTLADGRVRERTVRVAGVARETYYRVISAPVFGPESRVAAAVELVEDVTEHIRDRQGLEASFKLQRALNDMLRLTLEPAALPEKLGRLLDCLLTIPWFEVEKKGMVFLVDGDTLVMAAQRNISPEQLKSCGRVPSGRCLCGKALLTGLPVVSADPSREHDISFPGIMPHGHICVPFRAGGAVLGVLNLYTKPGYRLEARQREFVEAAAGLFAGAVMNARTEEQFLQAQKLEVVGRLAAGVAHDFANILTVILGNAHLLLEALAPDHPLAEFAKGIRRSVRLASSVTHRLLAFSRKQVAQPRCVDLNTVVLDAEKMLCRLLGESVKIALELEPSPWPVTADITQMEQVLLNLAINARDAMPQGGVLTIRTSNLPAGPEAGPCVRLSVSDTGIGMDEAVRSRLFEPFFTTKERGRGTGLGLATVAGIVQEAKGRVEVRTSPGQGTSFHILLPRAEGGQAAMLPGPVSPEARGGTESILVVEDNQDLLDLIVKVLKGKGYRVRSACGAEEAIAPGQQSPGAIDLVLLDVVLPGIGSKAVADHFRALKAPPSIMLMSGHLLDRIEAIEGLRQPLLEKPFSPDLLLTSVRSALDAPRPDPAA
ncbi:MAG: GAF domain-containing protein [Elusimicrobia bacterium]|nr:GAF domain-containing protein [Elusimicrobiota bacterium]